MDKALCKVSGVLFCFSPGVQTFLIYMRRGGAIIYQTQGGTNILNSFLDSRGDKHINPTTFEAFLGPSYAP